MGARPTSLAAVRALAQHHIRAAWGVSVAIAVFAGLVAAVPMALVSTSRYGDGAVDRFVSWSDPPELVVNVCPPGVDPAVDGIDPCVQGVDLRDDARRIAALEHVRSVTVGGYVFGQGGPDPDPASWGPPLGGYTVTGDMPTAAGRPIILRGRVAGRGASDEIMLTEQAADRFGLGAGDRFHLTAPGSGDVVTSTVVGVVRIIDLLLPADDPTRASFMVREGWLEAHADRVLRFDAVLVQTDHGRAGEVAASITRAFEQQRVNIELFVPADERRNSNQAIRFESRALSAMAAASALAGAAVIGQVVARRSRSELSQAATLRAIGATKRFLAATVLLRWLPVATGAVAVSAVAVALSPALGPFGIARRAPWSGAPRLDAPVVAVGTVLLPLCLLVPTLLTVRRRPVGHRNVAGAFGGGLVPRVAGTFLRQSLERRSVGSMVSAVVVGGAALAALMGAVTVTASLGRVIAEPERFGAPYDALLPAMDGPPRTLVELDGLEGAVVFVGDDVRVGDDNAWGQALRPIEGLPPVPPVVFRGRAPAADDEVALAPVTLRDVGRSVGEMIEIPDRDGEPVEFRIVGVVPVTDGYEANVGLGALFTEEGLGRLDPVALSNEGDIALRVDPARRGEVLAALQAAHPEAYVPFPVPSTLSNANRISDLPVILALGGAAVAAATFAHALLVATRHRRRDLAVLRVLGLVRRQSFAVVLAMAVGLSLLVAVLGSLVGLVAGGWGWQLMSESFGVSPATAYPALALVAAPLFAVLVAMVAASWPARRAATLRPAQALRTD